VNAGLNAKHRATLAKIELRSGLPKWKDDEAMFEALGADVEERAGSRVAVVLGDTVAVFHRPHPDPEIHKPMRNSIRNFLVEAGVIT
jgi:hypothetical protein